jgi:hypothetical protein
MIYVDKIYISFCSVKKVEKKWVFQIIFLQTYLESD